MKLKNTHFFERHVEKIVLGLAVVFAMVVLAVYVLSDPYTVDVKGQPLSALEVENRVSLATQNLEKRIQDPVSPLGEMPALNYSDAFAQRLIRRRPHPTPPLAAALGEPGLGKEVYPPLASDRGPYWVPDPPAPEQPLARGGAAVLVDRDQIAAKLGPEAAQAYDQLVGTDLPRDFQYVVVESTYDMDKWVQALQVLPEEGQMIPQEWWRGLLGVVQVALERQTLLDAQKDLWGQPEIITPLPAAIQVDTPDNQWTTDRARDAVQKIQEHQDAITRAVPPPTVQPIQPAHPQELTTPAQHRNQTTSPSPGRPTTPGSPTAPAEKRLTLQAYDLTVQPGMEYRYRMRVSLISPLFRRDIGKGQKQNFFNRLSLDSQNSPWSRPVRIDPRSHFFVLEASLPQQEARLEVWRLFNGRMQSREFKIKPGDAVGGVVPLQHGGKEYKVDMSTAALLVDVIQAASTAPTATGIPSAPEASGASPFGGPGSSGGSGGSAGSGVGRRESVAVILYDQKTNALILRDPDADRNSPLRTSLAQGTDSQTPSDDTHALPR